MILENSVFDFLLLAYLLGIPVNLFATLFIGYKAGDLKRRYAKTIFLYVLTSWFGIVMFIIHAAEWVQQKRVEKKRFPR